MRFRLPLSLPLISAGFLLLAAGSSQAVQVVGQVANGDSFNTTDPGSTLNGTSFLAPLPWGNVGQVSDASGIFLGDLLGNGTFWMITAGHVAGSLPSSVTLNSTSYTTVAGSYHQLHNPSDNSVTDLAIFQLNIASLPSGLSNLSLNSNTPVSGEDIYYVGYGGGTKRWGFNDKEGSGSTTISYAPPSTTFFTGFFSDFDTGSSNNNEAQAIVGDSGGAAFSYDSINQKWLLTGIMLAVDTTTTPNRTFSANIATYRTEILQTVPEPSSVALLVLGLATLGNRRRRRA